MVRDRDRRGARPRLHEAAPGGAARAARHLPRPGPSGRRRAPAPHRGDGRRAAPRHRDARRAPAAATRASRNYWGYSTLGFFAPHPGYASVPGAEVEEFRAMVDALHAAGIEVHPRRRAQPHLRGRRRRHHDLVPRPRRPGLLLPARRPRRRHHRHRQHPRLPARRPSSGWCATPCATGSTDFGVDGFRIDLASVLGRPRSGRSTRTRRCSTAIATDPVLSHCKLIAEPWDATGEGYRVGGFGVAVVGVERPLPRRRPRLLARRTARSASWPRG